MQFDADQGLLANRLRNAVSHGGLDVAVRVGPPPDRAGFYLEDDGPESRPNVATGCSRPASRPDPRGTQRTGTGHRRRDLRRARVDDDARGERSWPRPTRVRHVRKRVSPRRRLDWLATPVSPAPPLHRAGATSASGRESIPRRVIRHLRSVSTDSDDATVGAAPGTRCGETGGTVTVTGFRAPLSVDCTVGKWEKRYITIPRAPVMFYVTWQLQRWSSVRPAAIRTPHASSAARSSSPRTTAGVGVAAPTSRQ